MRSAEQPAARRAWRSTSDLSFQIGAPRWGGVSQGREYATWKAGSTRHVNLRRSGPIPRLRTMAPWGSELHTCTDTRRVQVRPACHEPSKLNEFILGTHEHIRHQSHVHAGAQRVAVKEGRLLILPYGLRRERHRRYNRRVDRSRKTRDAREVGVSNGHSGEG